MPITSGQTKRKLRAAGRRGRAKQAKQARRTRCFQVRRALEAGSLMNISEIASAAGGSPSVVRAALKEMENVERIGVQYRLATLKGGQDGE